MPAKRITVVVVPKSIGVETVIDVTNAKPGFRSSLAVRHRSLTKNHRRLPLLLVHTMPVPFDSIPQEVLENITFYAVASNPLGPPRELAPLLLVNRRLHGALSSASNPHLHSRIFASKFDTAALVRRLGPGAGTARKLAAELRRRCVQLARLRDRVGCTIGELAEMKNGGGNSSKNKKKKDGSGGMTEEGMRAMHEMLWTAYVMMLENDGKNERQLREYANLHEWLRAFWFAEDGASFASLEICDNAWPPYNDLADVTMWLFWFLLRPGESLDFGFYPLPPSLPLPLLFFFFFFPRAVGLRIDGASTPFSTHTKRTTLRWTMQNYDTLLPY
jgi:hypothetical protein